MGKKRVFLNGEDDRRDLHFAEFRPGRQRRVLGCSKAGHSRLFTACLADSLEYDPFAGDMEFLSDFPGDSQQVVFLEMKIDDLAAGNAVEMVVKILVGIKPPGISPSLHHVDKAEL
jgi:hypothetical protein